VIWLDDGQSVPLAGLGVVAKLDNHISGDRGRRGAQIAGISHSSALATRAYVP
jgi:hypothetical protein